MLAGIIPGVNHRFLFTPPWTSTTEPVIRRLSEEPATQLERKKDLLIVTRVNSVAFQASSVNRPAIQKFAGASSSRSATPR